MSKFKKYNQNQAMLLPLDLRDWVPSEHVAIIINQIVDDLDLSFLEEKYSKEGCPAYDPSMMIKILFYAYNQGIRSSRKIEKLCTENIVMRFLSANQFPDHGTINSFRKNSLNDLETIFAKIIFLCDGLGMININDISIDGSIFKANASRSNTIAKDDINKIKSKIRGMLEEAQRIDKEEDELYNDKGKKKKGYQEIPEKWRDEEARAKEIQRLKNKMDGIESAETAITKKQEKVKDQDKKTRNLSRNTSHNKTDRDANIMKMKGGKTYKPAYNAQIATSNQVILAYDVNDDPTDTKALIPMIEKTEKNTKAKVETVKADSGYFSEDNLDKIKAKDIDAYIPDQRKTIETREERNNKITKYDRRNFKHDEKNDELICPEGKRLKLEGGNAKNKNYYRYICSKCHNCKFKQECVKGKGNKAIKINWALEKHKREMRKKLNTKKGKKKYLERMNDVEPPFSNIAINQNARNFLCRGKPMVKIEFGLSCIAHNLTKITNWINSSNNRSKQLSTLARLGAIS